MNTASISLIILLGLIVLLVLLFMWLAKTFASMSPKEKRMYEQEFDDELAKKSLDEKELRDKIIKVIRNEN